MSFISGLFGAKTPKVTSAPPPPRISDAASEGAVREFRARAKKKKGVEDTILTSNLGGTAPGTGSVTRQALGG